MGSNPMTVPAIVLASTVVVTVVVLWLLRRWIKRTRRKARRLDTVDLQAISGFASSRGMTVLQAAQKNAFTASGTLEGIQVSLTTSNLRLVVRGRTAVGPIETHLRARGLPANSRALVARPLTVHKNNDQVENPPSRGADLLPTGDGAFDAVFRCYAADPQQLQRWLDPTSRQQIRAIPELREVRLTDGELSISLIPTDYVGERSRDEPWYHVRPLISSPTTLDSAAKLLARLYENAKQMA